MSLSTQTGISIGMPGNMPHPRVGGFSGRMTAEAALKRLLQGTGLRAIRVGNNAWRIVTAPKQIVPPRPAKPTYRPQIEAPVELPPPPVEIVVTAAKRSASLDDTPVASVTIGGDSLQRYALAPGPQDVAKLADGLTLSNLGPGRNRAFLRGIGDSPFNGQTQSTVATIFNNARVGFNAPQPELKLIDIDRIELLKGPQGPLYGTGALGGVFRIVANNPNLTAVDGFAAIETHGLSHGGMGLTGTAMVNLPLSVDRLGVRAVIYKGREPGWIDTDRPDGKNSNDERFYGGRVAIRWKPSSQWTLDLTGLAQFLHVSDSQYANAATGYRRVGVAAEPHDNDFAHTQLSLTGKIGTWDFVSTTGFTHQEVDSILDASPVAPQFGLTAPLKFADERIYGLWDHETRVTSASGPLRKMIGLSWLQARTRIEGTLQPASGSAVVAGSLHEVAKELAVFGELGLDIADAWQLDAGLRLFRSTIDDEKADGGAGLNSRYSGTGLAPSLSISYRPAEGRYYYARMATAARPRGLSAFAPSQANFKSDELTNLELGGRWHFPEAGLSTKLELYGGKWSHVQSDYLLPNGLVATRNSGNALIYGAEASLLWKPGKDWTVDAGFEWQHATLEQPATAIGITGDPQLAVVPRYKGHVELGHAFDLGEWRADATARATAIGPSRLAVDSGFNRRIDGNVTLDLAVTATRSNWSLTLSAENVTNQSDDSFAFGNPFSLSGPAQRTPLKPRRFAIGLSRRFGAAP